MDADWEHNDVSIIISVMCVSLKNHNKLLKENNYEYIFLCKIIFENKVHKG